MKNIPLPKWNTQSSLSPAGEGYFECSLLISFNGSGLGEGGIFSTNVKTKNQILI